MKRLGLNLLLTCGLLVLATVPASSAQDNEDAERRLSRVTVSRPSPFVGTLHVKTVIKPSSDSIESHPRDVELLFVPVVENDQGEIIAAARASDGRHRLIARRDQSQKNDPYKLLPTEKMILVPGRYVLSQIRFLDDSDIGATSSAYCLADGSFSFTIRARDTLFLGQLVLSPPEELAAASPESPRFSEASPIEQLKGWRRRPDGLSRIYPREVNFAADDTFCPESNTVIAGW